MTDVKRERRSGQRLAARVPVSIKAQKGTVEATGFTRDLNVGGIFLYTDSRIVAGSELEMVLILPPEITHGAKQWVCCRAWRTGGFTPGGATRKICEIFDDKCISFGAIMQALELLRFKAIPDSVEQ